MGVCHWRIGYIDPAILKAHESGADAGEEGRKVEDEIALPLSVENLDLPNVPNSRSALEEEEKMFDFIRDCRTPMRETYYEHIGNQKHLCTP